MTAPGAHIPLPRSRSTIDDAMRAIHLCVENRLFIPAAVLIYTTIDTCASLSRPKQAVAATRVHFISWAERYMGCHEKLGLTGLDLYAARCGVVHGYSATSLLSKAGKARPIHYAWGDANPEDVNSLTRKFKLKPIVIHVDALAGALVTGVEDFFRSLDQNPTMHDLVIERLGSMFEKQPRSVKDWIPDEVYKRAQARQPELPDGRDRHSSQE